MLHRFIGKTSIGHRVGIELSAKSPNGNNGWIRNKKYFSCEPGHGYFVAETHLSKLNNSIGGFDTARTMHILILGTRGCGKTTIFRQMERLYNGMICYILSF